MMVKQRAVFFLLLIVAAGVTANQLNVQSAIAARAAKRADDLQDAGWSARAGGVASTVADDIAVYLGASRRLFALLIPTREDRAEARRIMRIASVRTLDALAHVSHTLSHVRAAYASQCVNGTRRCLERAFTAVLDKVAPPPSVVSSTSSSSSITSSTPSFSPNIPPSPTHIAESSSPELYAEELVMDVRSTGRKLLQISSERPTPFDPTAVRFDIEDSEASSARTKSPEEIRYFPYAPIYGRDRATVAASEDASSPHVRVFAEVAAGARAASVRFRGAADKLKEKYHEHKEDLELRCADAKEKFKDASVRFRQIADDSRLKARAATDRTLSDTPVWTSLAIALGVAIALMSVIACAYATFSKQVAPHDHNHIVGNHDEETHSLHRTSNDYFCDYSSTDDDDEHYNDDDVHDEDEKYCGHAHVHSDELSVDSDSEEEEEGEIVEDEHSSTELESSSSEEELMNEVGEEKEREEITPRRDVGKGAEKVPRRPRRSTRVRSRARGTHAENIDSQQTYIDPRMSNIVRVRYSEG